MDEYILPANSLDIQRENVPKWVSPRHLNKQFENESCDYWAHLEDKCMNCKTSPTTEFNLSYICAKVFPLPMLVLSWFRAVIHLGLAGALSMFNCSNCLITCSGEVVKPWHFTFSLGICIRGIYQPLYLVKTGQNNSVNPVFQWQHLHCIGPLDHLFSLSVDLCERFPL